MKNDNICKFPASVFDGNGMSVLCFVRETDTDIMQRHLKLSSDRIVFCIEGEGTLCVDGADFSLKKGALLFCFSDETVFLKKSDNITYMYIDFSGARAEELLRRFDITSFSRAYDGFDGLIPLWSESLFRASDKTVELVAESILLYTLSRLFDEKGSENGLIGQIIHITEKNFKKPELSISSIAQELSYNPKYLSHIFKERARVSYSEYLRSVRLKYATTLFDHGLDSVKNVALLAGFSDPLYFSNVFKKNVGVSPKEYIGSVRNKDEI